MQLGDDISESRSADVGRNYILIRPLAFSIVVPVNKIPSAWQAACDLIPPLWQEPTEARVTFGVEL